MGKCQSWEWSVCVCLSTKDSFLNTLSCGIIVNYKLISLSLSMHSRVFCSELLKLDLAYSRTCPRVCRSKILCKRHLLIH